MVASGRLGCCCIVGCPSNSINPMNPGEYVSLHVKNFCLVNENAIEERPDAMAVVTSEDPHG